MKKKIAGYQVTTWNNSKVTKLMGLKRAMQIAYDNDCKNDYQHHIDRKYVNGDVALVATVTEHTADFTLCAEMTHRENNIARKFAEEHKLFVIERKKQ